MNIAVISPAINDHISTLLILLFTYFYREKAQIWLRIEKEFNASSTEHHRDAASLKGKYNNSKKCTTKKIATHKAKVTGTGGGPYTPLQLDELDHKIIEIVGTR